MMNSNYGDNYIDIMVQSTKDFKKTLQFMNNTAVHQLLVVKMSHCVIVYIKNYMWKRALAMQQLKKTNSKTKMN